MSTTRTLAAERSMAGEWLSLLRPKVALMVLLTALVGALLAEGPGGVMRPLEAALYITLVTGCASILNQVLERDTDAKMDRTRSRALVTGRVSVEHAIGLAVLCGVAGTAGLALQFNLLSAVLVLATLVAYVAIYTPLKRVSSLNTVVGAVPGAAPPLIGFAAMAGEIGPWGWSLFATIFAWQFPHFMAIAWLYREDYARAGHRMVPALPHSDGLAGRHALLYALVLLPISILPALNDMAGPIYLGGALLLGIVYLGASFAFALRENRVRARVLLIVSLAYLPLLLSLVLLDPIVRDAILR